MYPNSMPDIMILAQAVLQIFWHDCFTIQKAKVGKPEIIQLNIYRILTKLLLSSTPWPTIHDPSSSGSPDILLTRFHRFTMQNSKNGHNSAMTSPTEKKKNTGPLIFMLIPFKILSLTVLDRMQSVTDAFTHRKSKTNMPPRLLRSKFF